MYRYLYIGTLRLSTYDLVNALAFFVSLAYNLFVYKQTEQLTDQYSTPSENEKVKPTVFLLICICQFGLCAFSNKMLAKITVGAGANYFGGVLFSPFLLALVLILMRLNPLKHLDLLTPSYALSLVFFKLACFMHGCCEGIPTTFGFYYPYNGQYEFPSQLLEAFVALMIFIILVRIQKQSGRTSGLMFPLYLILYSGTRFCTEFTRANAPVIWNLQPYHLYCLVGILFGSIEWTIAAKYGVHFDKYFKQRFTKSKK